MCQRVYPEVGEVEHVHHAGNSSGVVDGAALILVAAPEFARAGMTVDDIDLWEIKEAFAAVPMKTIRDLELDPEKVNVNGGAIALGYPDWSLGCHAHPNGSRRARAARLTTALVTMRTGGGMGHSHDHRADLAPL